MYLRGKNKKEKNSNSLNSQVSINTCSKLNVNPNKEQNIEKIMNVLLEKHFGKKSEFNINFKKQPSKTINLNEILPVNNSNLNKINYQKIIEIKKWQDELYSIIF